MIARVMGAVIAGAVGAFLMAVVLAVAVPAWTALWATIDAHPFAVVGAGALLAGWSLSR